MGTRTLQPDDPEAAFFEDLRKRNEEHTRQFRARELPQLPDLKDRAASAAEAKE